MRVSSASGVALRTRRSRPTVVWYLAYWFSMAVCVWLLPVPLPPPSTLVKHIASTCPEPSFVLQREDRTLRHAEPTIGEIWCEM